jgi:hypothetical protein
MQSVYYNVQRYGADCSGTTRVAPRGAGVGLAVLRL